MDNKSLDQSVVNYSDNSQLPQQQPFNPVYPQPYYCYQPYPPSSIKNTRSIQDEFNSTSCGVYLDYQRNAMYLTSHKHSVKGNELYGSSYPNVNTNIRTDNSKKSKDDETLICSGTVSVKSYCIIRHSDQKEEITEVLLRIKGADNKISEKALTYEEFRNRKKMGEVLATGNVIMHPGGKVSYIMYFLEQQMLNAPKEVKYDGYFCDSNGLRTNNDEWIFRNAAEPSEFLKCLNIDDNHDLSSSFFVLTYVLIGSISRFSEIFRKYGFDIVKLIVFISSNNIKAENELCELFCSDMNPLLDVDKDLQGKMHNNFISMIRISNETVYTVNKTVQRITSLLGKKMFSEGEYPCDTIAVMAVKNRQHIKDQTDSEQMLLIPYSSCTCGSYAVKIANWFQTLFLKDREFVPRLIKRASEFKENNLEPLCCDDYLCGTFSMIMAAAEVLLRSAGVDKDTITRTIDDYGVFLTGIEESADSSAIDALREYITGKGRDILIPKEELPKDCTKQHLIAYDANNIYLTTPVFCSIAKSNQMTPKQFAQSLKDAGFLTCGEKFQRNIVFPQGQARVYSIPEDKLFGFGQIRSEPNDFANNPPALMIQLGECDGKTVYFSMSDLKGTDNGHIYITGQSGSGKSYFLKKFSRKAAEQGIEVVFIGTEDTCPDFDDCAVFEFGSENSENMTGSFHTFIYPLMQSVTLSAEAMALAEMLETEKSEFYSVSECIERLRSLAGNEPAAEELIGEINKADCYGIYSDAVYWDNVCRKGRISIVKSVNDDKTFLDSVIRSFYEFKCSQSEISPCLLVLDECQVFDLEQGSALIDLILRRGRKHGIMAVLTSQYLTATDGRNITRAIDQCDTYIAFKPGNSSDVAKRVGVNVKDSESRNIISGIDKYNCIARGRLSTDRCMINYPLIIHIPK